MKEASSGSDSVKTNPKSRFKRLFERKSSNVLRISATEKPGGGGGEIQCFNSGAEFEPSSVLLAKMVRNFIEENNERPSIAGKYGCNCFNGYLTDNSDEEYDFSQGFCDSISSEACEILNSLVPCVNTFERNLLADITKMIEKNKIYKQKQDSSRKMVNDSLIAIGYNSSICKSRWEKSSSYPSGEHEYIDVMKDGERVIIDIDFRSEFEIARSTSQYKSVLQCLPSVFVGKADRLKEIVSIVSEAAKQSLKKKGMPLPPWRKAEYMRSKWLSTYTRMKTESTLIKTKTFSGEFELFFGEKMNIQTNEIASVMKSGERITVVVSPWKPPAIKPKPKPPAGGTKMVAGLASVLKE